MKKYYNQFFALMLAMLVAFGFFGHCFLLPSSNEEKQKEQVLLATFFWLQQSTLSYCAFFYKYDADVISGQNNENGDGQFTYSVMILPLTEADCNIDFLSWDKQKARALEKLEAEFSSSCVQTKNFILNQHDPLSYIVYTKTSFIQGSALEELKNVIIAKNLNISDLQFATPEQFKEFLSLSELHKFSSWGTFNNEASCKNAVESKIAEKFQNTCSLQHPGGSPTSSCSTTKNLVVTGYCGYGDLDVYNNDGNPDYVSCSTLNDQF